MNKEVAVLLSTYNGHKYLSELIKSIQNQTYTDWKLYIRDDGSRDDTLEIIKAFMKEDNRIIYLNDEKKGNLKPMKSFFRLLELVNADYYFFCDQDDVWLPDKISNMLKEIKKDNSRPELLYCGLKVVDSKLNPIENNFESIIGVMKGRDRFIGNEMPGCTVLINKSLRDMAVESTNDFENIVMHDWWLALIGETFGDVQFLNKKFVLYRQHGDNVCGAGKKGSIWSKVFQKGAFSKRQELVKQTYLQTKKFYQLYKDKLDSNDKIFFQDFLNCSLKGWVYRIKILNKYKLNSSSFLRTCAYRLIFVTQLNHCLRKDFD